MFEQNREWQQPILLENRRYIGSKTKLAEWIMQTISGATIDVGSFCDLFAGTGIISKYALRYFPKIIINDFLISNYVIYYAFFAPYSWDKGKIYEIINGYNSLTADALDNNYFSEHFGDKYYEYNTAKKIGFIREDIECRKHTLTYKEYSILLTSLLYSIDKIANTVGHFEAYIKKPIKPLPFLIRPIEAKNYPQVEIFQSDANNLIRKIEADLVYIDPPYNSRQYSRFYHLYENLVKWEKPELFGTALKPKEENMSLYCTTKAQDAFEDLVKNVRAKYIVVSYNNTYKSKSSASKNKIGLEDMISILEKCGETQVFEHSHKYFNTGKTDFSNHKEFLFLTKIDEEKRSQSFASLLCRR